MLGAIKTWAVLAMTATVLFGSAAEAAEYNVTKTDDIGGICGAIFGGGYVCTLRQAINMANANPGLDTIILSRGLYQINETVLADDDSNGLRDFDITDDVHFEGDLESFASPTYIKKISMPTIDGGHHSRVFHIHNGVEVEFDNVKITGGLVGSTAKGGGILVEANAHLTLRDSEISENEAGTGGGIHHDGAELKVMRSLIAENIAIAGAGLWIGQNSTLDRRAL